MFRLLVGWVLILSFVSIGNAQPIFLDTSSGTLSGTLELPTGKGPFPVALIIAGSGPTDRDGNSAKRGLHTNCYKLLADALANRQIASVRYDKRGIGGSAPAEERALTIGIFVQDAVAWGRKLKHDKRFTALVIIGHSEGALVGSMAAPYIPADKFISIAGPGEPIPALLLHQLSAVVPPDAYAIAQKIIADFEYGKITEKVPPLLNPVLRPSAQPFLTSLFRVHPAAELAKLKMPVLIVQGERDLQVGVNDAHALAQALPAAELVLLPDMDHVLKDAHDGYTNPERPVDPTLIATLGNFILKRRGR